jgi:hypothetical protein
MAGDRDGTELSLPSFASDESYENPSWAAPERLEKQLETQLTPSRIFGPVGEVDYLPRGSDGPMCVLTPLPKPALPSSQPTNEDNQAGTRKRYRSGTLHPGDIRHTPSPQSSPLIGKAKDDAGPPWGGRTRSGKKAVSSLAGSSLSQPPRRKIRTVLPAKSSPPKPKTSPSKPSLLKQAPRRNANNKVPSLSQQSPLDESLNTGDKIRRSYEKFAPHIPLETGPSAEGEFNMFRVNQKSRSAVLSPKMIREVLKGAEEIARNIWLSPILDDTKLRVRLGSGSKDFLDLPQVGSTIMDVASVISQKIAVNNESAVLWKFFRYCILRVEHVNTGGNLALGKELGRYQQDVAMLYECFLGIFYRLGSVWDGRQLSLLNSLCEFSHQ